LLPLTGIWLYVSIVVIIHALIAAIALVQILLNRRMTSGDRVRWLAGVALVPFLGPFVWHKIGRDMYFDPR
jgi:hypothetical protein